MKKLILIFVTLFLLFSCKDLNDNPNPNSNKTMKVPIGALLEELSSGGALSSNGVTSNFTFGGSPSQTEVKSLIIGAMVVYKRDTPYSDQEPINKEVRDEVKDQLIDSANYFKILSLPTEKDTIELDIPPEQARHWQVVVIAERTRTETLAELEDDDEYNDSFIYYALSKEFYNSDQIDKNTVIKLTMKRACLSENPPKGCAVYDDKKDVVITSNVEIVNVIINSEGTEDQYNLINAEDFPLIVKNTSTLSDAKTKLEGYLRDFAGGDVKRIRVITTHRDSNGESSTCKAASDANLTSSCTTQTYQNRY